MSVTGQDIVNAAYEVKGAPYRTWYAGAPLPMWVYDGAGDPPSTSHIKEVGVMCSDLVSYALERCGLPPCYGTENLAYYLENQQPFDPSTPGQPGAICLRPYTGPALADQGHVAIYVDEHTVIQALVTPGVTDSYTDTQTYSWGGSTEFTVYGLLPGVDYSGTEEKPSSVLTPELLVKAMTSTAWSGPNLDPADATRYFPHLVQACRANTINTRARLSAFLAQVGTESGSFKWWREFSRGKNDDGTDKPFGNWYGRGPMQLTWEANYQNFQKWTGYKAHDNPEIVADDAQAGFHSAGWYWRNGNGDLNTLADLATWQSFREITGRVWGQAGPVAERDSRYEHAWNTLPENLVLPGSTDPPSDEQDNPVYLYEGYGADGIARLNADDCTNGWRDADGVYHGQRWTKERGYW